jgi:spore germination protein KC
MLISARVRLRRCMLLFLLPLLLSGCWDRREIEERAVVLAISVDMAKPADADQESDVTHLRKVFPTPGHPLIRIAAQIAVPGRIPLGPGEGGGSNTKPVWVLEAVGHTIDDAITTMQQQVSDPLFYGHLRVIVVSEAVARSGMSSLNDYLRRHPEVRRLAWMAVTKGNAASFMKTAPELERVPALYLLSMFDHAVEMGKYPNEFVGKFWSKMSSLGREPHLPYLKALKDGNIEIAGLAYFKGERMAGITKPLEIGSYMAITGEPKGGYTVYAALPGTKETIMFKSTSRQARRSIVFKDGKPLAKVHISIEGDINEKSQDTAAPLNRGYMLEQIQSDLQDDAATSYEQLIQETQEAGSDIFGFGELIRAKHPAYWSRSIRTKDAWQEQYKELAIEVTCDVNIRRVGMKAK